MGPIQNKKGNIYQILLEMEKETICMLWPDKTPSLKLYRPQTLPSFPESRGP